MKKAFLILCLFVFLTVSSGICAFADGKTAGGFGYRLLEDGTACLTECSLTGDVMIPEQVDGYPVTCLENSMFRGVSGITSITLPASVVAFSDSAYNNLLAYVFPLCYDLQRIEVAAGNPVFLSEDGVLYSKNKAYLYAYPCAKSGTEFHVPATVVHIDCNAFSGVKTLRSLWLDNPEINWAMYSFAGVEQLTVYYYDGGHAEERVKADLEEGRFSEDGVNYPLFVSLGSSAEADGSSAKADSVIAEVIRDGMTPRQQAKALHDWIILHARYTMNYDTAAGILIYGEGLCEAYAKAYQLLLNKVGIENRLVTGKSREDGTPHMWNQVKIGNIWYHVDCTWDDPVSSDGTPQTGPVSGLEHDAYFMVSTQRIRADHILDSETDDAPGWTATEAGMAFLKADGSRVTGWLEVDGDTFYFDDNGISVIGEKTIDGETCRFDRIVIYTDAAGSHAAGRLASSPAILRQEVTEALETALLRLNENIRYFNPGAEDVRLDAAMEAAAEKLIAMNAKEGLFDILTVSCPVHVQLQRADGSLAAETRNHTVLSCAEDVCAVSEGETDLFIVPHGKGFRLLIAGTGTGEANLGLCTINEDLWVTDLSCIVSAPLSAGTLYQSTPLSGAVHAVDLIQIADPTPDDPVLPGDVNGDGVVDGRDAVRLMKYLAGETDEETGEPLWISEPNSDLNGDGLISELDLLRLMKFLSGALSVL